MASSEEVRVHYEEINLNVNPRPVVTMGRAKRSEIRAERRVGELGVDGEVECVIKSFYPGRSRRLPLMNKARSVFTNILIG